MWALKLLLKKNAERHRFDNLRNDQTSMITRTGATAIFLIVHVEKQGNDLFYRLVEWKKVCNTRPLRVRSALSNHVSRVDEGVKSPNSPRNDRNDRSGKLVIAPY